MIRYLINDTDHSVINIDKLTYAGNLDSLTAIENSNRYSFHKIDICSSNEIEEIFARYKPDAVMHLAAESHVDRSISSPDMFIQTNVFGTYTLLEESRKYFETLNSNKKRILDFIIFLQMKYSGTWEKQVIFSMKIHPINQALLTQHQKLVQITW